MPKRPRVLSKIFLVSAILLGGLLVFLLLKQIEQRITDKKVAVLALEAQQQAAAVPEIVLPTKTEKTVAQKKPAPVVPESNGQFKLKIPFISQAPTLNWDAAHEDYCEEASLLMAVAYLQGKQWTVAEQEIELEKIKTWEEKTFGYFESTTAAETVRIAQELFGFKKVRIIENPTIEKMRVELAANHILIVPADGKALRNPFFKNGGPNYHMLVVRGFTANNDVITNDPGTRHGENFVYKKEVLLAAIHDLSGGSLPKLPASGAPRIIVIE